MITKIKKIVTWMLCAALFTINYSLFTSCQDFFETDSDRQIFDPALDQKTDSMFYTLGILKSVQQVADQYVLVGEMRGDLVQTNQYTETDLRQLADFSADVTNKYDSAYTYYRIINNCNYYIAHRDTSLRTGSRRVAIPEYAEALAVRAWAYLQLCKNYGEVPFYTEPLTSIGDANKPMPTKGLQAICDALAPELLEYSGITVDGGTPVPDYGAISAGLLNSSNSESAGEKSIESKNAMIPVDVILGDLYLETHQYENAARHYFQYLLDNKVNTQALTVNVMSEIIDKFEEMIPKDFSYPNNDTWKNIFNGLYSRGTVDMVTYIPLATNRLRGVVTELPRYFGYDFYNTTIDASDTYGRYLQERQIDASAAYYNLSNSQEYYYASTGTSGGSIVVNSVMLGDWRRYDAIQQVRATSAQDSTYSIITKFNSATVPLYRIATIYLRLGEALNRMGYPDAAFAILKDGIDSNPTQGLRQYVERGDSTDLPSGRYIRQATAELFTTTIPFFSEENEQIFQNNHGIHSRGCYYTDGKSPYQYQTIVGQKLAELTAAFNLDPATFTLQDTINAVEDLLCDEMALELAFEGNRFGDLTRLARHKNNAGLYGANFGSEWLARKLDYKNPVVSLRDEKNWYLPLK